jgi:hypothetical protein
MSKNTNVLGKKIDVVTKLIYFTLGVFIVTTLEIIGGYEGNLLGLFWLLSIFIIGILSLMRLCEALER